MNKQTHTYKPLPGYLCATLLLTMVSAGNVSHAASAGASAKPSTDILYGVREHLPVQSEGGRFMSTPYGESELIVSINNHIQELGQQRKIQSRGINLPNKAHNQYISQYNYTFPKQCGAFTFSSYHGEEFSALGLHYKGVIILDAITTSGPYASPRIWGLYDQLLNEKTSMNILFENPGSGEIGLTSSAYMVGMVATFPEKKKQSLGAIYKQALSSASKCINTAVKTGVKKPTNVSLVNTH